MMMSGSVEHTLDDKNRIRIPKRFRDLFPEGEPLSFVKYLHGCIAVFPTREFYDRVNYMAAIRSNDPNAIIYKRTILCGIVPVDEDSQGRASLPGPLREYAGITKDVITVGMIDYVEIWDADRFKRLVTKGEIVHEEDMLQTALTNLPV